MTELSARNLTVRAGGAATLNDVSVNFPPGRFTAVIGPNGAGKSTLLRALVGLVRAASGTVTVDEKPIARFSAVDRARRIAYLPQHIPLSWPVRVHDAVAIGRFPAGGVPGRLSATDGAIVQDMLALCAIDHLADRQINSLSGGELTRVHIARTLATQAPILVVDEPVAALDPAHQLGVLQILRAHADHGGTVIAVLHDLALAGRFADHILALKHGRIACDAPIGAAFTNERLSALYDVPIEVTARSGWPSPYAA